MGQYHLIVNLDKQQYIHPHNFNDGLKLLEFGCSGSGAMTGLAILLADSNNRGGGDLRSEHPIIGSWAGDRITITGDYGDEGRWLENIDRGELQTIADEAYAEGYQQAERVNLYAYAQEKFADVSAQVLEAMAEDAYIRDDLRKRSSSYDSSQGMIHAAVARAEQLSQ